MDEYIRKADALAVFRCRIDKRGHFRSAKYITEYEAIERLPAADVVERKKGKWIRNTHESGAFNPWYCSVCGNGVPYQDQFCSNCGADMRGVDNGTSNSTNKYNHK